MCPPDAYATTAPSTADLLSLRPVRLATVARRGAPIAALIGAAVATYLVAGGSAQPLWDALSRAAEADWRWLAAAVVFEALSFAGYVYLLQAVARQRAARFDVTAAAEVTFASTAVTRLLPTAGVGGAALTVWALRRAGLGLREATETLLTFLLLLYGVYMSALLLAGGGLALGLLDGPAPGGLTIGPALLGGAVIVGALAVGLTPPRKTEHSTAPRNRLVAGAAQAVPALRVAVRNAIALVRAREPRLLGALGWWAFDIAVLAAMLAALGATLPIAAAILAYFVGTTANLVPFPGAVATGMVGVHVAFGVPAAIAIVAVLAYRAIALWLPAAGGALAIAPLRRTVAAWAREDAEAAAR